MALAHEENLPPLYRTEPPEVLKRSLKRRLGEAVSGAIMPLITRAARPYLGGAHIEDALVVASRLEGQGLATSFSYWDNGDESLAAIEKKANAAIAALSSGHLDRYLAVKPPALRFSEAAAIRLAHRAAEAGMRLHFDSHGTDVTCQQNRMIQAMHEAVPCGRYGVTLPGRHTRSLQDAGWAAAAGLFVRVVKGEWPDPLDPKRDGRAGFLEIIGRLAGAARHVAVATHDLSLAREAISRLQARGTSCEIEVLLGMATDPLLTWARDHGVTARVYVPYGVGFIPNAVGVLRRNPRLALTIAKAQLRHMLKMAP